MLASSILDREHKTLLNLAVFLKGTSQRSLVEYDICGSKWKRRYWETVISNQNAGYKNVKWGQKQAGVCGILWQKRKQGLDQKNKKFVKRLKVVLFCCGSWPAVDWQLHVSQSRTKGSLHHHHHHRRRHHKYHSYYNLCTRANVEAASGSNWSWGAPGANGAALDCTLFISWCVLVSLWVMSCHFGQQQKTYGHHKRGWGCFY